MAHVSAVCLVFEFVKTSNLFPKYYLVASLVNNVSVIIY